MSDTKFVSLRIALETEGFFQKGKKYAIIIKDSYYDYTREQLNENFDASAIAEYGRMYFAEFYHFEKADFETPDVITLVFFRHPSLGIHVNSNMNSVFICPVSSFEFEY